MGRKISLLIVTAFFLGCYLGIAQNSTSDENDLDASMFWKSTGEYVHHVESEKGDLYTKLGHHGPAIENLWVAYRVYFNEFGGVDIFSKFHPRLELKDTKWYPSKTQRIEGYGSDNYQAGKTTGLGGVKLWDGNDFQNLGPVDKRTAEIILNDSIAQIRMTSYAIPYQDSWVDIQFTLTTLANSRHAVVEVRELTGKPVQFVTGMSIHSELKMEYAENYVLAWGDYNSHEKHAVFNLGTALIYDPNQFQRDLVTDKEFLLISQPTSYLKYWVTSANEKEHSDLNTYEAFESYVQQLQKSLH
ncbi:MAG: DUF4861 family protein [Bacteroidetes bacterium]|nr:DUF4861 family protein [Bacteroidota bacterium]